MAKEADRFTEKIKAIQDTMYVIGGKWKLPIMLSIYTGNTRFNSILHSIPLITNRVLSKELKSLEENLLIKRTVIDGYPVQIEYTLTTYGSRIGEVVKPMEEWGKNHRRKLMAKHKSDHDRIEE